MVDERSKPSIVVSKPTAWDTSTWSGLYRIWAEDWRVHGGSPLIPAIQALTVYRFGQWLQDPARSHLTRIIGSLVYRAGAAYARNVIGYEFRDGTRLGRRVRFYHQHGIVIDPGTEIGDDTAVRHGVTIGLRLTRVEGGPNVAGARIGARVEIGAGAKIIGAVRIGDGASIGPNAVVMTDVPAGASVIAAPSRTLRLHDQ